MTALFHVPVTRNWALSFIHVRKSHIWFPLSNISKSIEHNVGDHNRNAKFNFGLYLISHSGVMPLDLPKNTALLQLEWAHPCPILLGFFYYQFTWTKGPGELLPSLGIRRLLSVNFSHFKLLLRNHWADWNQTQQECSLDGPLQSDCFSFQSDIQYGCQGQ